MSKVHYVTAEAFAAEKKDIKFDAPTLCGETRHWGISWRWANVTCLRCKAILKKRKGRK